MEGLQKRLSPHAGQGGGVGGLTYMGYMQLL